MTLKVFSGEDTLFDAEITYYSVDSNHVLQIRTKDGQRIDFGGVSWAVMHDETKDETP
jgi:hypothetical protein